MVAAVVVAAILLGLADYFIRFEDRGLRLGATLTVLAVFGWTTYRWLRLGLIGRLGDVDLARWIQRRFPALGDSLASAVEFLRQQEGDEKAGSVALRQAVIAQTAAETERLDFLDVIQTRSARRAVVAAVAVFAVAVTLVAADRASSSIGLARLINPFGNTRWPQFTHLAVASRRPHRPGAGFPARSDRSR